MAILNINSISKHNLSDYLITLQQSLDSLKAINLPVDTWDVILVFLITRKLDNSLRTAWEINRKENSIATLSELLEFLNLRRTAFELLHSSNTTEKQNIRVSHHTSNPSIVCSLCQNNHSLYKCPNYLEMTVPNRIQFIKTKSLCYNCLQPYQTKHKCSKYKCLTCRGRHHTSIHMDKLKPQVSYTSTITTKDKQLQMLPTTPITTTTTNTNCLQTNGSTPYVDQSLRISSEQPQALTTTMSTTKVPTTTLHTNNAPLSTSSTVLVSNTTHTKYCFPQLYYKFKMYLVNG